MTTARPRLTRLIRATLVLATGAVLAVGTLTTATAGAADPGDGRAGQALGPGAFRGASLPDVPATPFDPDYDVLPAGSTDISDNLRFVTNVPNPAGFEGSISSNLAFDGDIVYQGGYNGLKVYDASDPESPELVSSVLCPGAQGDLSLAGDLLFFSVDAPRSSSSCDSVGVASSTPGNWEGIRIFDVSDPTSPEYVSDVETRCGSHTHTLVTDLTEGTPDSVLLYNSAYDVSTTAETCTRPHEQVELIEVPLDAPEDAAVVDELRFWDAENPPFEITDRADGGAATSETNGCHDLTSYPEKDLLAAACMGDGLLLDISDPAAPVVVDRVRDENFAFWHTAQFNDDATKVIFQDELGGGGQATCTPSTPQYRGADALYDISGTEMELKSYFKIPRRQSTRENCVGHEGNILEIEGRDVLVQAYYRGGVSVFDFTDSSNPVEIGYFDRGPQPAGGTVTLGGSWAAYSHNGYIWSSEIAEGLDVLQLQGPEFADALRYRMDTRNPATQTKLTWDWKTDPVLPARLDRLPQLGAVPSQVEVGSGTSITVTAPGDTFEPGEYVDVWTTNGADLKVLASGRADDAGGASLSFDLPRSYAGGTRYVVMRGDEDLDAELYAARIEVAKAASTVTATLRDPRVTTGQRAVIDVAVASSPTALGRVQVTVAGATVGARLVDGAATLRLPRLAARTYTLTVRYAGSPRVTAGAAEPVTLTVVR